MPNVTMSIEEDLLKKVRKIAVDRDTTVSDLFRSYLSELSHREETRREFAAEELDRLFQLSNAGSNGQRCMRDDLYDR